jgi:uncharacterized OsmC-like protein
MTRMRPSILIRSQDADTWGRHVSVEWPGDGWNVIGDNAVEEGGTDRGPDGFGFMGAALGICMVTTLIANAKQEGIGVERVSGLVSTKARVPSRGAPHLTDFHIELFIEGPLTEADRALLEEMTASQCGVRETLKRGAAVSESVSIGSPPAIAAA